MWFQYLSDRGPFNREKIWHTQNGEQPASIIPPLGHITDGPSGLVHYPGTGLTKDYDGTFFIVDFRGAAATSGVREFRVVPQGATYRLADYKTFVSGVLATDCDFAPNGDFYVLDWVEGWNGPGTGRIHRLRCNDEEAAKERAETQSTLGKMADASSRDLVALLSHADMRVRMGAQQRLVELGAGSAAPFAELACDKNVSLLGRLHAIWGLGQLAEADDKQFEPVVRLLADKDAEVRAQAVRTLARASHASDKRQF
jgi:quinoprotein glucose dehydrogenase